MSDSNVASPMARAARPFVAALALLVAGATVVTAGTAWAGGWSDYKAAFPLFPCQDGWSGCLVDGNPLTPDLAKDASGMPVPSDFRVGWDLKPTASFSPFVLLSPYSGKVASAEPPPEAPPEAPPADPEPVPDAPTDVKPDEPKPDEPKPDAPKPVDKPKPDVKPDAPKPDAPKPVDKPKPGDKPVGTSDPKPADPKPVPVDKPGDAKVDPPGTAAISPGDDKCDNLTRLEPSAMLGKLTDGQIACLETSYAAAKQTEKDKISRVLMGNAYSKGDLGKWEKLMKRHLDEVDQSDPDLCYKYAQYLQKKGSADGAIKWANVALERKTVWTGDTFTQRVSALMKIRAAAAQSKWKKAEDENAASPSPELQTKVDASRNQTKVFAREWYEYAKQTGKDASTALQLCVSAAGTKDYCEGGG